MRKFMAAVSQLPLESSRAGPILRGRTLVADTAAMPIYEYVCATCGQKSDHLMRMSDPDPTECPTCGPATMTRAVSAPQFRLAGGGWYETDFKKDGDKKRNLVEFGGGGDSKPADATTPAPAAAPAASSTD
jgi:putative FmdB family regulatory protein